MGNLQSSKNKEKVFAYLSTRETNSNSIKRKTLKEGTKEAVKRATYLWFLQERARGTPISGHIIAAKALQFNSMMQDEKSLQTFKASLGWLDNFKRRHGIRQLKIVGEKLSADTTSIKPFVQKLSKLMQEDGLQ